MSSDPKTHRLNEMRKGLKSLAVNARSASLEYDGLLFEHLEVASRALEAAYREFVKQHPGLELDEKNYR